MGTFKCVAWHPWYVMVNGAIAGRGKEDVKEMAGRKEREEQERGRGRIKPRMTVK